MDFKQLVIENAWGGLNMDYGLLHVQLATPVTVAIIIFVMIIVLNKLLFKPVLRTLDNRQHAIDQSQNIVEKTKQELDRIKQDFEKKQRAAQEEVRKFYLAAHHEAELEGGKVFQAAHQESDEVLKEGREILEKEIEAAKIELGTKSGQLADLVVKHLLN